MKVTFRKSFARDLRKLRDQKTRDAVEAAVQTLLVATRLSDLSGVEALTDHPGCFRLRVGSFRIGLYAEGDTVEIVRCLHRREIYRFFP